MIWLVATFYLLIWATGGYLIWKAYHLGIKNNLKYAKKPNGQPYKNPKMVVRKIALADLSAGLSIILFAMAIPLLGLKFQTWASFIGGVGLIRLSITMGLVRKDET